MFDVIIAKRQKIKTLTLDILASILVHNFEDMMV